MTDPAPALPEGGDPYRIAVVCLGNICRSPMAHVVLEAALDDAGLADRVEVTSSGTGGWHAGEPMDSRAAATLAAADFDPSRHRAAKFDDEWTRVDLILAMDHSNLADIAALEPSGARARLHLFRDFDPEGGPGAEVPDPWYGGQQGFDEVLAMVERTVDVIVGLVAER